MKKIFNKFQIELDIPSDPKYLICCDVDETYLPHKINKIKKSGIQQFEKFFLKNYKKNGYILCWITGSSLSKFKNKVKFLKVKPHAIASDLGSEIFINKNGSLIREKKWYENKHKKLFYKDYKKIYLQIKKYYLTKKESFGVLRKSFYVYGLDTNKKIIKFRKFMKLICKNKKINYNISKSSSAAGDPKNTYDLDIIPYGSGKLNSMLYLKKKYSISSKNVITFGDSFNDFDLMNNSNHRFLVGNASLEVKKSNKLKKKIILKKKYCKGILEGMKIFEKKYIYKKNVY